MALWPRKSDDAAKKPVIVENPSGSPGIDPTAPTAAPPQAEPVNTVPAVEPGKLNAEQMKVMAATSKRLAAAFGDVVSLFMRTPDYRAMPLGDLEWLVVPAIATGQYTMAEAQSNTNGLIQPMGVVLWAHVSAEVDQRLSSNPDQPVRLTPREWTSGDQIWMVEAVGESRAVQALLQRMAGTVWKDKTVKIRTRGKDGKMAIGELSSGPPQQPSP
ncbi:MAG: toxin-activating lysine-acyltransferase [Hyphomicrobium sp.]